jgi:hypothetical protein
VRFVLQKNYIRTRAGNRRARACPEPVEGAPAPHSSEELNVQVFHVQGVFFDELATSSLYKTGKTAYAIFTAYLL